MMKSWFEGKKVVIIWPTTCCMLLEWKTWLEMVSIMTINGKSERITFAATEKA